MGVAKISRLFFLLPPPFSLVLSLSLGSSRGILVVFEVPGPSNARESGPPP